MIIFVLTHMKTITIITISLWLASLLPSIAKNFPNLTPEGSKSSILDSNSQHPATSNMMASKDLSNDSDGNYLISNANDLLSFANMVNNGQTDINGKLTADIFLNDTTGWQNWNSETQGLNQWIPIGSTEDIPFEGTLDGQGHTIYGLFSCNQEQKNHGLVGILGQSGSIRNINLMAGYLNGETAGGLCVQNYGGEIANCHNHLTIEGEAVGGICAGVYNKGVIVNCYNNASIKGDLTSGGICAYARNGSFSNCYNTGTLEDNGFYTGSLAGRSDSSTFTQCYWMEGSARLAIGINQNPSYDTIAPNNPEQFHSGEIAYNLGDAWGQIIGSDNFPVWRTDNNKVYRHQLVNIEETDTLYANLVIKELPEPTRTGYTFEGWFTDSIDGKEIRTNDTLEANSILYARWSFLINRYVITFINHDSTLLQRDTLEYGTLPAFRGEEPTKDATAEFSYTFAGWNPEIDTVTEDATYIATYTAQPRIYILTLNVADTCEGMGTVNGEGNHHYGDTITISATANKGYIFLHWNDGDTNATRKIIITSDTTLTATFGSQQGSGTGIDPNQTRQPGFRVLSLQHGLKIEGSHETASIYDATGRLIYKGTQRIIYVKSPGIYIVRIGKQSQRVMVG